MSAQGTATLRYHGSREGAEINYAGSTEELMDRMIKRLTKLLAKKGITLMLASAPQEAELHIRIVQIEQGNQLLRYLLPFIAPAFVELEVDCKAAGTTPETLFYKQTAQVGLFGGTASGMLGVCVDRIAGRMTKDLVKRLK